MAARAGTAHVVTIGCQTEIVRKIVDRGGNRLPAVPMTVCTSPEWASTPMCAPIVSRDVVQEAIRKSSTPAWLDCRSDCHGGKADAGIVGDLGKGFQRHPTTLQGPLVVLCQQKPLDQPAPRAACSPDQGESVLLPAWAAIRYAYDSSVVVCAVRLLDQLDRAAPFHLRDLHASIALGQNSVETVARALQAASCLVACDPAL